MLEKTETLKPEPKRPDIPEPDKTDTRKAAAQHVRRWTDLEMPWWEGREIPLGTRVYHIDRPARIGTVTTHFSMEPQPVQHNCPTCSCPPIRPAESEKRWVGVKWDDRQYRSNLVSCEVASWLQPAGQPQRVLGTRFWFLTRPFPSNGDYIGDYIGHYIGHRDPQQKEWETLGTNAFWFNAPTMKDWVQMLSTEFPDEAIARDEHGTLLTGRMLAAATGVVRGSG